MIIFNFRIFILVALSIFYLSSCFQEVHAISYNGSPTYQIPDIGYWSNVYYTYGSPTGSIQAFYSVDVDTNVKMYQHLAAFKIPGWKSFSGEVVSFKYQQSTSDTNAALAIFMQTGATVDTFWYKLLEQDTTLLLTGTIMEVPHNNTCPWLSGDCVYFVIPVFIAKNTTIGGGLYIPQFEFYYFYDSLRTTINNRVKFNYLTYSNADPFTNFLTFFGYNINESWRLLNYRNKVPTNAAIQFSAAFSALAPTYQYWTWNRTTASLTNDVIIRDFLQWHTWGTQLTAYWPTWINSSYWYSGSVFIGTITESGWTTWSSTWTWFTTGWYDGCSGFDLWCWLSSTFSGIFSFFVPDTSINWDWETYACNQYTSLTGSVVLASTWTTSLWFLQRFANIISAVKPIPPLQWASVCLFNWDSKTVNYRPWSQADILFILLIIFPLIFSFHLIKPKNHD